MKKQRSSLPPYFKSILWSYQFSKMDPDSNKERIIINAINHGDLQHWRWIRDYYGKPELQRIVRETPRSEFRFPALKLFRLVLNLKQGPQYETRSAQIQAEKEKRDKENSPF